MRHSRVLLGIGLASLVWAVGCSSGGSGDDDDDITCTDECSTAGTSCDSDTLVTCAMGTNGCLFETTTDCTSTGGTCDDSSSPAVCTSGYDCDDVVTNGDFETGAATPWAETNTQGSPLCSGDTCTSTGTSYANTGDWWMWFGGWDTDETATISQDLTLPAGETATLYFFVAIPWEATDADTFDVTYNGNSVFSIDGTDQAAYSWWTLVEVDLSSYADGAAHPLLFTAVTAANVSFFLDDVYVLIGSDCCVDACTVDMTQCDGDAIQTCVATSTCNEWSDTTDCSADSQTCGYDDNGDPVCTSDCTSDCDTVDATQCSDTGEVIQTCTANADGCNYWVDGTDCAADSQLCDDSGDDAVCVACISECDTVDATQCSDTGEVIQTCTLDADGCNYWVDGTDCAADSLVCDDSGDTAVCAGCVSDCDTVDATQCSDTGEVIQTCTHNDTDGCDYWEDTYDCADDTELCDDSGDDAVCVAACTEVVTDGSFETGDTTTDWDITTTNYGTPMCDSGCSSAGNTYSHTGDWWVWFGGYSGAETASVGQDITLPSGVTATLAFWVQVPDPAAVGDTLVVTYGGSEVFTLTGDQYADYPGYKMVTVDLSSYADDAAHSLLFTATTGASVSFFLDDVTVIVGDGCCIDECTTIDDTSCFGTTIQVCTAGGDGCNDLVDDYDCGDVSHECDDYDEPAVCWAFDEVTVDGGWQAYELYDGETYAVLYFYGDEGTTYYVWWDDAGDGSGSYDLDLYAWVLHDDVSTIYAEGTDGYTSSQAVTIGSGETYAYIWIEPDTAGNTGTYAFAVTSTDTQP